MATKYIIRNTTDNNVYIRTRTGNPQFGKATKAKLFGTEVDANTFIESMKAKISGKTLIVETKEIAAAA